MWDSPLVSTWTTRFTRVRSSSSSSPFMPAVTTRRAWRRRARSTAMATHVSSCVVPSSATSTTFTSGSEMRMATLPDESALSNAPRLSLRSPRSIPMGWLRDLSSREEPEVLEGQEVRDDDDALYPENRHADLHELAPPDLDAPLLLQSGEGDDGADAADRGGVAA